MQFFMLNLIIESNLTMASKDELNVCRWYSNCGHFDLHHQTRRSKRTRTGEVREQTAKIFEIVKLSDMLFYDLVSKKVLFNPTIILLPE